MKTYEDVKDQLIEMTQTEKKIMELINLYISECGGSDSEDCDIPAILELKKYTLNVFALNHGIRLNFNECALSNDNAHLHFGKDK
jgi:hypothetical protein